MQFITITPTKSGDYGLQATNTIIILLFIKTEMENQLLQANRIQFNISTTKVLCREYYKLLSDKMF